jgi:hypothetical protein
MTDFMAAADCMLLERNGLGTFEELWAVQLDAVDEPNTQRGGWSSVYRLDLEGQAFYLKRQSNYLTRTLQNPMGEPSFSREFRNISRYQHLGIPALEAVFYGERKMPRDYRAILMTRALEGWDDLDSLLGQWPELSEVQRQGILRACGLLARKLHGVRQVHGCFYPKHIFMQVDAAGYRAQLIDLEKTRALLFGQRDRVKDIEPLLRRAPMWTEEDIKVLLAAYLQQPTESLMVFQWLERLGSRRDKKGAR